MMTDTNVPLTEKEPALHAIRILNLAASAWLTVATIGQWLFGVYIISFYGKFTVKGEFERWNEVLPHGYVEGDWKGNLIVGLHVLLAAVIVLGGPLQLIPFMRNKFPRFHRWLGRIYVTIAILVTLAGLFMIWTRGGVGDATQRISISIQGVYIISFALLAIRFARSGKLEKHRRWALRLYMVVNGVWFFRVGLMFWILVNGGPAGFDRETFIGPFLTTLSILTYSIPLSLIILEMYFFAQRNQDRAFTIATSAIILFLTIIMGIGIFGATMGMWIPRLK